MTVLTNAKLHIAAEISSPPPEAHPFVADQWIVSSLLQKAIRRGDVVTAQRAALTFYLLKKFAIWRRLMIIAFEDVGAGSADALAVTVAAGTDATFRKACGGDVAVALYLTRMLAEAPKDRSADYLICGVQDHPSLENARHECGTQSTAERLNAVATRHADLPRRSLAVWYASGVATEKRGGGDLSALMDTFRTLGVPEELIAATGIAAARTREPIILMVPLVWLAAHEGQTPTVANTTIPASVTVGDIPLYALDKHTRLGREAIARFARQNDTVRETLERLVPKEARREAAMMAAFYADAVPVSKRLLWSGSRQLEAYGIETDFLKKGVPAEAHEPLLVAVRANLDHLNEIRSALFQRARPDAALAMQDDRLKRFGWTEGELTFFKILDRK